MTPFDAIARLRRERDEKDEIIAALKDALVAMTPDAGIPGLRPAENRLVGKLLESPGKTVRRQALRIAVFGPLEAQWPGDRTLDVHVCNARKRLVAEGLPWRIETVHQVGYRIKEVNA